MGNTVIFNSFAHDLSKSISEIDTDQDTLRCRFSKKRKFDEISYVIDDHAIIYDTESDDEMYNDDDLVGDFVTNDFRVWRRGYIKKYKCKN